jgi:hypothetical protein
MGVLLLAMILSETREELHEGKERAEDVFGETAWVRLPIRFSVPTTSVMGRYDLVSCEALSDETSAS